MTTNAPRPFPDFFRARPVTAGPYRAEFGAIHHQDAVGFLFTVSGPGSNAEAVAEALNRAEAAADHEPVAYQRQHPVRGWIDCDPEDIPHYRSVGQAIRALGVMPVQP